MMNRNATCLLESFCWKASSGSRKDGDTEGLHHHTLLQENTVCLHHYALASERMNGPTNEWTAQPYMSNATDQMPVSQAYWNYSPSLRSNCFFI